MHNHPNVSIVINNYNYGRFIGDAIESALAQTYPHVEVIVVDDGSTDDSRRVIGAYRDKTRAILKANGGQASALNTGFAVASGDLLLFLDSDDTLLPAAAETVVREWREDLALLYFPLQAIDASGRPIGRLEGGVPMADPARGPFSPGSPTSGNVFSRALLARAMPIPEDQWKVCADSYLTGAASLLGGVKVLTVPLGKYRVHGTNNFAHREKDLTDVRCSIRSSFRFHEAMRSAVGDKILPLDDWLGADPRHWVARIRSLREGRADHPWPDTLPALALRAAKAAWHKPGWNLRRRLAYTTLIFSYAIGPRPLARALRKVESNATGPRLGRFLGRKGPLAGEGPAATEPDAGSPAKASPPSLPSPRTERAEARR